MLIIFHRKKYSSWKKWINLRWKESKKKSARRPRNIMKNGASRNLWRFELIQYWAMLLHTNSAYNLLPTDFNSSSSLSSKCIVAALFEGRRWRKKSQDLCKCARRQDPSRSFSSGWKRSKMKKRWSWNRYADVLITIKSRLVCL